MGARHSQQSSSSTSENNIDTVTRARLEREKQGTWEAEISYGGEADLQQHLKACKKHPDHLQFVPVDKFNVDHLPSDFHHNYIVDLIHAMSDLTVRVTVKYVSEKRPKTVPGSDKPYPCYSDRGSDMMRVGTGWINNVSTFSNKTCECKECLNSSTPKTEFAHIDIRTAAHVVYDKLEGAHTTCHLFFDRGGSPEVCNSVVTLAGMSKVLTNPKCDWCRMIYFTHDLELAARLNKMVQNYELVKTKLDSKCHTLYDILLMEESPAENKLTIIVSHPHGCSKQISLGYDGKLGRQYGWWQFMYTTATCPGSSGACVYVLGRYWVRVSRHYYLDGVHCGHCEDDKEFNYCYAEGYIGKKK